MGDARDVTKIVDSLHDVEEEDENGETGAGVIPIEEQLAALERLRGMGLGTIGGDGRGRRAAICMPQAQLNPGAEAPATVLTDSNSSGSHK